MSHDYPDVPLRLSEARDDLLKSDEQREAEAQARNARRQFLRNLADVVQTPEGYAVACQLLDDLGLAGECPEEPRLIALRNFGELLLDDIYRAAPNEARALLLALREKRVVSG